MFKIDLIAGARPNLIKLAPLLRLLKKEKNFFTSFIYTGQHYDKKLYSNNLSDLKIQKPDINLGIGSGTHNYQISNVMKKYDGFLKKNKTDLTVVFGDVNSTLGAALAAKNQKVKVAHIEAGLRCYDDNLQEEVNRRLTDSISDYLFTPSINENKNLFKENIKKNIFFVGNIMIDSLKSFLALKKNLKLKYENIDGIFTLHRPENVDKKDRLTNIIKTLKSWTKNHKILFPIHPRTMKYLIIFDLVKSLKAIDNLKICNSLNYNDFLLQVSSSKFIITDSGGLQEETSYLGIPCFTIRNNTERPITILKGTNKLVKINEISDYLKNIKKKKKKVRISKWDGKTSLRILKVLKNKIL